MTKTLTKSYIHSITQEKINQFAEVSGDKNPLHVDPVYAGLTKFGKTIAHGVYLLSLVSKHLAEDFGTQNRSPIITNFDSIFRSPVYSGDTIEIVLIGPVTPNVKSRIVSFSISRYIHSCGNPEDGDMCVSGTVSIR